MVKFPDNLIAGETLVACVSCSDAESITAVLVGPGKYTVEFTQSGSDWKSAADSSGWDAGSYAYEIWATFADGSKKVLRRAGFKIEGSLEESAGGEGFDALTRAERIVEKIESMIEGNASAGVKSYKINNRELERYSVAELMQLLAYWQGRVTVERRKARGQSPFGRRIAFTI